MAVGREHTRPVVVRHVRVRHGDWLFRANRIALHALVLAFVPGIALIVAGLWTFLSMLVYWGIVGLPITSMWLILALPAGGAIVMATLGLLGGLLPLFFRKSVGRTEGARITNDGHPDVIALIDRVSRRLATRPPDAVFLSPFGGASIGDFDLFETAGEPALRRTRVMELGAELIVAARVDELLTVICHEMAHASAGDTAMARRSSRLFAAIESVVNRDLDAEHNWLWGGLRIAAFLYHCAIGILYATDSRYCELRADRVAAEICGPQRVRDVLIRIHLTRQVPHLRISSLITDAAANERDLRNAYQTHRDRWRTLPAERRAIAEAEMFNERTSAWDSHPSLSDRLRNLAAISANEISSGEPATALFRGWAQMEQQMTQRLMDAAAGKWKQHWKDVDRYLRVAASS